MAVPVVGVAHESGALHISNDGTGILNVKVFQHAYNSAGENEPMLIREVNISSADRLLLAAAIADTE